MMQPAGWPVQLAVCVIACLLLFVQSIAVEDATRSTETCDRVRPYPKASFLYTGVDRSFSESTCDAILKPSSKRQPSAGSSPLLELLKTYKWFTESKCSRWAVATAATATTEAVNAAAKWSSDWCLIVVADKQTQLSDKYNIKRGVHLTVAIQEKMATVSPFISKLSWNQFGRKNVGYLVAALHGAAVVWDFDDGTAVDQHPFDAMLNRNASQAIYARQLCQGATAAVMPYPHTGKANSDVIDSLNDCSERVEVHIQSTIMSLLVSS
jgi:hypothetical protein